MLGGTAAIAFLSATGLNINGASAAAASAPTSADGVIALARSYLGQTLLQVRPQTDSPWSGYPNADWCMWFVSWCLRGVTGGQYLTYADQLDYLPATTSPRVGDIAVFGSYHVGFVSQVAGGIKILDGNRSSTGTSLTTRKVNEGNNFDSPIYRRPPYFGSDAPISNGDDMPYYAHKQSTAALSLTAGVPNRLTFNGIGDYDLAGTPAGGPGLYDITCHIYFEGLIAPASVALQFQYEDVSGGATEGWYTETVQGSATGTVKAQISTKLPMTAGRRLMLFAAPSVSGVTIPVWGRLVCNWKY